MKIKWLGHSSFLITSENGTKIVTDPYTPTDSLTYAPFNQPADIITISHDHFDHNNIASVKGGPVIVKETKTVKDIQFQAIPSFHDESSGKERGKNNIFCFTVDGVRVCHLGDLGQMPTDSQIAAIGEVDVLLSPVGGNYTIDPEQADKTRDQIKPRIFIPMHFRNEMCRLPISGVEEFLRGKRNVTRFDGSEIELKPETLPNPTKIVVLQPAMKTSTSSRR